MVDAALLPTLIVWPAAQSASRRALALAPAVLHSIAVLSRCAYTPPKSPACADAAVSSRDAVRSVVASLTAVGGTSLRQVHGQR